MGRELIVFVLLIAFIPLMFFELPVLIAATPKWILKLLCFLPFGSILFLEIHAFLHGTGNLSAFLISIPVALMGLYGGFSLKSMVDGH